MSRPAGIRFTEEMGGYITLGEEDSERGAVAGRASDTRILLHLTVVIADLTTFAADPLAEALIEGWIHCDALGGQLPVEHGAINLFGGEDDVTRRQMRYLLSFNDGVGHPLTLTGIKTVRSGQPLHVWTDTTTLNVRILWGQVRTPSDRTSEITAAGIVRLRPREFLRQLGSFRTTGRTSRARITALGRFGLIFATRLYRAIRG